jgi:small-conductance mechanosensitive channel
MSGNGIIAIGLTALAAAVAAALVIAGLRLALALLPLRRDRRALLSRVRPAAELAIVLAALVFAATRLAGDQSIVALVALGAVLGILVLAAWPLVRDVVSGVALRAEEAFEPDDWVRVAGVEGRVLGAGARALEIEAEDGRRTRVPYARISRSLLVRGGRAEASKAHTFTVTVSTAQPLTRHVQQLREAALLSFHASARRDPRIRMTAQDQHVWTLEVTVYALDPAFLPEIESAVRRRAAS